MAGTDVAEHHAEKKRVRAKGRRVGVRIDMTPLVDVAFLLLTFFMYTTSMTQPQTMEINIPPDPKRTVPVGDSKLLTLRASEGGEIFWSYGLDAPKRIDTKHLRAFLREQKAARPGMVALLRIERSGKFESMINLLDELNLADIERFSLAPFRDEDRQLLTRVSS